MHADHSGPDQCPLVIIPTFNEALTLARAVAGVHETVPAAHVLVVDDASPDGTGQLADSLAADDDRVHVLHRVRKNGLGAAYLAGFAWARERGYDVVVEMDADGSHRPDDLPRLLGALDDADVVLGSRYVPGGAVRNWPWTRRALSRGGNLYVRTVLGLPLRDATGGYRVFTRSALDRIDLATVASQGYCFQVDLAWRAVRAGLRVVEVPITFVDREHGASKMGPSIVAEALLRITRWGLTHRLTQVTAGRSTALERRRT